MKAITIRNVPLEVAQAIRRWALEKRTSLNKAVIGLLAEQVCVPSKKKQMHHELDHLFGKWAKTEAHQFQETLARQRAIDPEVWK